MKLTQRDRIIRHIQDNGSISSMEAYLDYGITQLGARIFELKEQGYKFNTEHTKSKNRYGETVYFKKYSFAPAVSQNGETGEPKWK